MKAAASYGTHPSCFYNITVSVTIPGQLQTEAVKDKEEPCMVRTPLRKPARLSASLQQGTPVGHDVIVILIWRSDSMKDWDQTTFFIVEFKLPVSKGWGWIILDGYQGKVDESQDHQDFPPSIRPRSFQIIPHAVSFVELILINLATFPCPVHRQTISLMSQPTLTISYQASSTGQESP